MEAIEKSRLKATATQRPLTDTGLGTLRDWFTGRRGLVIAGIVLVIGGLAGGWNWLTAIGLAPLILALAPCAAMCALGLCMMSKGSQSSCAKQGAAATAREDDEPLSASSTIERGPTAGAA